jgi:hypothetical protein
MVIVFMGGEIELRLQPAAFVVPILAVDDECGSVAELVVVTQVERIDGKPSRRFIIKRKVKKAVFVIGPDGALAINGDAEVCIPNFGEVDGRVFDQSGGELGGVVCVHFGLVSVALATANTGLLHTRRLAQVFFLQSVHFPASHRDIRQRHHRSRDDSLVVLADLHDAVHYCDGCQQNVSDRRGVGWNGVADDDVGIVAEPVFDADGGGRGQGE